MTSASEVPDVEAAAVAGVASVVPSAVTMSTLNFTNQYPVFSASIQRPYTEIAVLRAPGEGGPWTELCSLPNDSATYTDTTCPVGVPCYYRVVATYTDSNNVRTFGGRWFSDARLRVREGFVISVC